MTALSGAAALREAVRILKPGARFVGATWELRTASAALGLPAFADYPEAVVEARFTVEVYEETESLFDSGWRRFISFPIRRARRSSLKVGHR